MRGECCFRLSAAALIGAFRSRCEKDGTKCLTKTIDNKIFPARTVFLGAPDAKNYTIEADVMSDGNKRKMSEVGVINQRYAIVLKGNDQNLEVSSNFERSGEVVDFKGGHQTHGIT